jgi:hypothetical protein
MVMTVRFAGDFAQISDRHNLRPPQWKPYNAKAWIYDGKTILPDKDKKQTTATLSEQVAGMATETGTFDCSFNGMALSNKDLDLYDDKVIGYMNDLPFSKTYQPALNYATIDAEIIHRRYATFKYQSRKYGFSMRGMQHA